MSRVTLMRLTRLIRLMKLVKLANRVSAKRHVYLTSPSIQILGTAVIATMSQTALSMAVQLIVLI